MTYKVYGWKSKNEYATYESRNFKIKDNAIARCNQLIKDGYVMANVREDSDYGCCSTSKPIYNVEV